MKILSLLHNPMLTGPHDVKVGGNCPHVVGKCGAYNIVDVSDKLNPNIFGAIADYVDNAHDLDYRDGLLYVTG